MKDDEILNYAELTAWVESTNDRSEFRTCAELLISAMNNWPTPAHTETAAFLEELKRETGKPLTLQNLNVYLNKLEFKSEGDSWKMESVASLLDIFNPHLSDSAITLDTILHNLTQHCRKTTRA
jgi:hypothetical protein